MADGGNGANQGDREWTSRDVGGKPGQSRALGIKEEVNFKKAGGITLVKGSQEVKYDTESPFPLYRTVWRLLVNSAKMDSVGWWVDAE